MGTMPIRVPAVQTMVVMVMEDYGHGGYGPQQHRFQPYLQRGQFRGMSRPRVTKRHLQQLLQPKTIKCKD